MSQDGTYKTPEKIASTNVGYGSDPVASGVFLQNDAGTRGQDWHKSDTAHSGNVLTPANENPGALAGATGADQFKSVVPEYYSTNLSPTMALCLAIVKCDPHDAALIMEKALSDLTFGEPRPTLFSVMDDASWWADYATPAELKAYALACFNRLSATDQRAFLAYVQRGAA